MTIRIGDIIEVSDGMSAVVYAKRIHPVARMMEATAMLLRRGNRGCSVSVWCHSPCKVVRRCLYTAATAWIELEHMALDDARRARIDRTRTLHEGIAARCAIRRKRLWRLASAGVPGAAAPASASASEEVGA